MYVYMPAFKRVRRVGAHVRNTGFMGTDFSPGEMSNAALSIGWDAKILEDDAEQWLLQLNPQAGTDTAYSKMIVTVSKSNGSAWKLECYDAQGNLVRTQVRSEWVDFGPISLPTVYTITDHRSGSKSVLRLSNCKVNQGIPDEVFTKRALIRGD
jgi:outer membrane lipoprotein-sorting protein